jgi:hypothetical protein
MRSTKSSRTNGRRFKPGDRVVITTASRKFPAEVTEDRGPLDVGGRRIYRIRTFSRYPEEVDEFEVPAEQVSLAK